MHKQEITNFRWNMHKQKRPISIETCKNREMTHFHLNKQKQKMTHIHWNMHKREMTYFHWNMHKQKLTI